MAGTPDRSGEERKTSGGPAPDERDPRLAVARETPSASGVDQATAVFSVRDVAEAKKGSGGAGGSAGEPSGADGSAGEPSGAGEAGAAGSAPAGEAGAADSAPAEEAGDARLRAAVAAWVSSGSAEGAEGSGASSGDGGRERGGDGSGAGGSDAAEPPAASDAAVEPAEGAKGAQTASSAPAEAAEPDASDTGSASGAAEPGPSPVGAERESGAAEEAVAAAGAGKGAEPAPGADAEAAGPKSAAAEDAGLAEGRPGKSAGAEPAEPAETATPAAAEPTVAGDAKRVSAEDVEPGGAKPVSAEGAKRAEAKPVSAEDAKPGGAASAAAEDAERAQGKPGEPAEPKPAEALQPAGAKPAATADAEPVASKPADTEDAEPKPVDAGDAKSAWPKASRPEPAESTGAESVASKPADPTDTESVAPKPVDAGDAGGAKSAWPKASRPEPAEATGAESDASKPADAGGATSAWPKAAGAGAGAGRGGKPAWAKDAEPDASKPAEAKDAESDAPESGKPADGGAGPQGVDQPTAVFKAVAPPVDRPTTMLKSPGAKETDAERTSRFVPLRPLDSKAAATPGAATAAATAAAATGAAQSAEPAAPERTTQQPLPPKPPLDLLAELTNTPPPPETRVRTTVRRFKIWTPLVLLLIVVFAVVQAVRPLPTPTLDLTAKESVSFEGGKPSVPWPGQGQAAMDVNGIGTFGTSGAQKPVPIASIAKVMSVYLILRDHPLKTGEKGPKIPVDAAAQKHYETGKAGNESVVKVTEGQQLTEYEALQAVMLPSANNVAKLLARWDTGSSSESAFVDKMNKTAKELGMTNTTYTDPSGLDKTTVSTAGDLVKLGRAAMENPVFKEISRQPSYVDLNGDKQNNFFGLVPTVAIGIKTGTTTAAGGNILFAAEKQVGGKTQTIIGAALGQYGRNGTANIDEVTGVVKRLIQSGQSALTAKTIVKKGDVVGEVDNGLGGTTPVIATKDVSAVGWSGLTVRLALDEKKGATIPHTAKAATEVGVLSVGDGKNDAVEVPVALQKDLAEPGFGAKIKRVA